MSTPNIPAGYLVEGGLRVKYELAWTPADGTATIIRSIYAGISGPHGCAEGVDSREAAERFAFGNGLVVSGEWQTTYGTDYAPCTSFNI
jgi:hypothetical protein